VSPLKPGYNPATWMFEVTGGSMATTVRAVEMDWPEHYRSSKLAAQNEARAEELVQQGAKAHAPLQLASQYAQPFGVQVRAAAAASSARRQPAM
jgi:hypothetical protein